MFSDVCASNTQSSNITCASDLIHLFSLTETARLPLLFNVSRHLLSIVLLTPSVSVPVLCTPSRKFIILHSIPGLHKLWVAIHKLAPESSHMGRDNATRKNSITVMTRCVQYL